MCLKRIVQKCKNSLCNEDFGIIIILPDKKIIEYLNCPSCKTENEITLETLVKLKINIK